MNKRELLHTIKILFSYDLIIFERLACNLTSELVNVKLKETGESLFVCKLFIKDIVSIKNYSMADSYESLFKKF